VHFGTRIEKAAGRLYVTVAGYNFDGYGGIHGGAYFEIDLRCNSVDFPGLPYEAVKTLELAGSRNAMCGWGGDFGTATLRIEAV
jgi:hypothetical protein